MEYNVVIFHGAKLKKWNFHHLFVWNIELCSLKNWYWNDCMKILNLLHFNFPHLFTFPTNFPHLLFFIFLFCSFIYRNTCYYNIHNVYYTIHLVGKVGKVIVFLQKFIQYTLLLAPCSLKYRKQRSEGAKGARSKHHFKYFCKTTFPTPHFPTFLMF